MALGSIVGERTGLRRAVAYPACRGGNFVRVNGVEQALGDCERVWPLAALDDLGFHFGIEAAFEADEAAGEGFERGDFGRAQRGGIEEFLEADGGLLFQRSGIRSAPVRRRRRRPR